MSHARQGDNGCIPALAQHSSLAKGHGIAVCGHLPFNVVEFRVFEEYHRVFVADRLYEQAFGIVGS